LDRRPERRFPVRRPVQAIVEQDCGYGCCCEQFAGGDDQDRGERFRGGWDQLSGGGNQYGVRQR
jgi:hypothetical protein